MRFSTRFFSAIALSAVMLGAAFADPLRGVIAPEALQARLGEKNLVVIDLRSDEKKEQAIAQFKASHIPGAVHADYAHASWRVPRDGISVYLPSPAQFEALVGNLGVSPESDVVIVHEGQDATSFGAAARVYWSFKAMGHASIAILDGGWRDWISEKSRPLASGASAPSPAIYEAKPIPSLRASLEEVLAAEKNNVALVDGRPESYYSGAEKHKAVKAFGHIPGAVSIPHSRALDANLRLKDRATLEKDFAAATGRAAIAYCNTGHWGATDWFVLSEILGRSETKLYDGSMLEYSLENKGPVSTTKPVSGS